MFNKNTSALWNHIPSENVIRHSVIFGIVQLYLLRRSVDHSGSLDIQRALIRPPANLLRLSRRPLACLRSSGRLSPSKRRAPDTSRSRFHADDRSMIRGKVKLL